MLTGIERREMKQGKYQRVGEAALLGTSLEAVVSPEAMTIFRIR